MEQAKRIARPSEGKTPLGEIRTYNSMVMGIQNYFEIATCISLDCRIIHRQVMTVLTNRLNSEKGCRLQREGGTMTQTEKERYGRSKMVRYVAGIDQPIYPLAFVKNKIPHSKRSAVCSYTAKGRKPIHTNLRLNPFVLEGLRSMASGGHSTEYADSRISLFSAQGGKCAVSGEEFGNASEIACWLKMPRKDGGQERYQNLTLLHYRYLPLLEISDMEKLTALTKTLNMTKKQVSKVNRLREQAGLAAID